ncbi:MAG: VOC family protein [Saprospiraceae bacterium]|nr:VOC family protein [Saprospiraceae bacterium]
MKVNPIPEGFHTVTPYLLVKDSLALVDFLKKTFDAEEISIMSNPDGTVGHGQMRIGNSIVMLAEARGDYPPMPTMLYLYVEDVDAAYQRGIASGGKSLREPTDEFYGDRSCGLLDACGNQWWVATHIEDVSPEEMQRREALAKNHSQN